MAYVLVEEDQIVSINNKLDNIIKLAETTKTIDADEKTMNVEEAAAYLGITKNTLYIKARKHEIPHMKVGRRYFFSRAKLADWASVPVRG